MILKKKKRQTKQTTIEFIEQIFFFVIIIYYLYYIMDLSHRQWWILLLLRLQILPICNNSSIVCIVLFNWFIDHFFHTRGGVCIFFDLIVLLWWCMQNKTHNTHFNFYFVFWVAWRQREGVCVCINLQHTSTTNILL